MGLSLAHGLQELNAPNELRLGKLVKGTESGELEQCQPGKRGQTILNRSSDIKA